MGPGIRICVLGTATFQNYDSAAQTVELESRIGLALGGRAVFVTGGTAAAEAIRLPSGAPMTAGKKTSFECKDVE